MPTEATSTVKNKTIAEKKTVETTGGEKTIEKKIDNLRAKRSHVELGGGRDRLDKQHAAGKLTARERVAKLVDPDSFQEIGAFAQHRGEVGVIRRLDKQQVGSSFHVAACSGVSARVPSSRAT